MLIIVISPSLLVDESRRFKMAESRIERIMKIVISRSFRI